MKISAVGLLRELKDLAISSLLGSSKVKLEVYSSSLSSILSKVREYE